MRLIKMFGLTAIAAVTAMAFMGTSSAMAELNTLLCNNATEKLKADEECVPTKSIHFVTVKHKGATLDESLELGKALLLTDVGITVECHALVSGAVGALGTTAQTITAEIVYTDCTPTCTITVIKNGTILVLKVDNPATPEGVHDELAKVTAHGFEVKVQCGLLINCTYNPEGLEGHGHRGHGLPHVTYKEAPVKGKGLACPNSTLDALFRSLDNFFIRS